MLSKHFWDGRSAESHPSEYSSKQPFSESKNGLHSCLLPRSLVFRRAARPCVGPGRRARRPTACTRSASGSLRHLAAPRSSSGAPNPRLLNPHRLHVDLPRNRFDRQSFTCDVVKLEYTYPQQVHRRNALTRTVGTNPSSESRRMLRAGGGRPERHLRAVRLERDGTQRTTSACSRGK